MWIKKLPAWLTVTIKTLKLELLAFRQWKDRYRNREMFSCFPLCSALTRPALNTPFPRRRLLRHPFSRASFRARSLLVLLLIAAVVVKLCSWRSYWEKIMSCLPLKSISTFICCYVETQLRSILMRHIFLSKCGAVGRPFVWLVGLSTKTRPRSYQYCFVNRRRNGSRWWVYSEWRTD